MMMMDRMMEEKNNNEGLFYNFSKPPMHYDENHSGSESDKDIINDPGDFKDCMQI
jgi:hypothetical protein